MALGELLDSLRTVTKSIGGWQRVDTTLSVIALTYIIRFRRELVGSHGDVIMHSCCWVQALGRAWWQWQWHALCCYRATLNISPCSLNSMPMGLANESNELKCHWPVDLWYSTVDLLAHLMIVFDKVSVSYIGIYEIHTLFTDITHNAMYTRLCRVFTIAAISGDWGLNPVCFG